MERSNRWSDFLRRQAESGETPSNGFSIDQHQTSSNGIKCALEEGLLGFNKHDPSYTNGVLKDETSLHKMNIWSLIRPSLGGIEQMMSYRVKKKNDFVEQEQDTSINNFHLTSDNEQKSSKEVVEYESDEEFYDVEKSDSSLETSSTESVNNDIAGNGVSPVSCFSSKEELQNLVRGGLPMALRGEVELLS